jgi:hypothetical protein
MVKLENRLSLRRRFAADSAIEITQFLDDDLVTPRRVECEKAEQHGEQHAGRTAVLDANDLDDKAT